MKKNWHVGFLLCLSVILACIQTVAYGYLNNQIPGVGGSSRRGRHRKTHLPKRTNWTPYNSNNIYTPYLPYQPHHPDSKQSSKDKVATLGATLKKYVHNLRYTANRKVDIVFLVDSSASVGETNFLNELKFVRKLLADFRVDQNTTRVALITFSSPSRVVREVDQLSAPSSRHHKCSLLEEELPAIKYTGGGTFTLGAVQEAQVSAALC